MEMTMRWYGKDYDTVTLEQIRQSCYVNAGRGMDTGRDPGNEERS